jgi:pimeloyl-ACP methyl ester carboxylesterase
MKLFDHKSGEYVEAGGGKIYFEEIGDRSKQPLLLLHGGFGNMEDFNGIIPLLDDEYRIIGIDRRGQGKSTLGGGMLTYESIQKDVALILHKLDVTNPYILGFSDGGIVAYRLASLSALEIKKLITIGASWHSKSLHATRNILAGITAEKWKVKFPETFEKYQSINPEPDFEKLTTSMVKMWIDENETGHPDENVRNIHCPTLIIRGDKDHLVSRESVFELSTLIRGADLANIPFAGHEVHAEQKEVLMKFVNAFLRN